MRGLGQSSDYPCVDSIHVYLCTLCTVMYHFSGCLPLHADKIQQVLSPLPLIVTHTGRHGRHAHTVCIYLVIDLLQFTGSSGSSALSPLYLTLDHISLPL